MLDHGIFDAHLHVIDPRFPLVPNRGYVPDPFTVEDYLERVEPLGVVGGAVVSGSFQAFDTSYLLDALKGLGPSFVGVAQLPVSVPDEEVLRLHEAGVRAVRFNLERGGSETPGNLERLAKRVYEVSGWHAELYADSVHLTKLEEMLARLPRLSIDHLGLSVSGFRTLLRLVERGARVKATGFGRLDFDPGAAMREISAANPDALMFGTDLPSTRARRPFRDEDVRTVIEALDEDLARKALLDNAAEFYRPGTARAGRGS
ncbi:amidohydrolase family protein [Rubrobacter marinus]|uniref:Amidohydrolase family protein n=1 Tax=Rubrobacter marinus TaxID=2653852 RepID=A0A6G8PU53_9ACTN|nr:amidohydrolase family protein [Rubrobacter marinus]QIN77215.1 amidohydrolase family protein [Rubrobacter marinus]